MLPVIIALALAAPLPAKEQPKPRPVVTPQAELAAAMTDLGQLPPDEVLFTRYLTTYAAPQPDIEKTLAYWVNSLSSARKLVNPTKLSDTLYRVDLRDYGWTAESWIKVAAADPYFRGVNNGIIVRADWWITQTSDGNRSLAYYQMLYGIGKEPKTADEFRKRWAVDLNLARGQKVEARNVIESGESIVAFHNRILAQVRTVLGDYWQTFDTINDTGARNAIENLNGTFQFDAGEHIVSLPNGLHAYLLSNAAGTRIEFADPAIAHDRTAHLRPTVDNPISCVRCHGAVDGLHPPRNRLPELLKGGAYAVSNDKEIQQSIENFYLTEDGTALKDAQRSYAKAIFQTNGLSSKENSTKFGDLVRWYDGKVTLAQASIELGCTPDQLKEASKKQILIAKDDRNGQLATLVTLGSISRNVWETNVFQKAQTLLLVAK
jgi:hypothetical protein